MLWDWKVDETFQFFVEKRHGTVIDTTDTRYFFYDRMGKKWRHSATITNPNGGTTSVATIGGGLNSFLENFGGRERALPKLALYRLWLGSSPDTMKCLTKATGDGKWGKLHDAYFLAEGSDANLTDVFAKSKKRYGEPMMGVKGKKLEPITELPLDERLIAALKPRLHDVARRERPRFRTTRRPCRPSNGHCSRTRAGRRPAGLRYSRRGTSVSSGRNP